MSDFQLVEMDHYSLMLGNNKLVSILKSILNTFVHAHLSITIVNVCINRTTSTAWERLLCSIRPVHITLSQ